jgi:hypothetical protein
MDIEKQKPSMLRNILAIAFCVLLAILLLIEFKGCERKKTGIPTVSPIHKTQDSTEKALAVIVVKEEPIKKRQDDLKEKGASNSEKSINLPTVKKAAEKIKLPKPDSTQFEKYDSSVVDSVVKLAEHKEVLLKDCNAINLELSNTIDSLRKTEEEKEVLNKALIAKLRADNDSVRTKNASLSEELEKKRGLGLRRFMQGFAVGKAETYAEMLALKLLVP